MSTRLRVPFFACLLLLSCAVSAAEAPNTVGRSLAATCFTCHGTDGRSAGGVPPGLAGRNRAQLVQQLQAFKAGNYPATVMHQLAKGYTDAQIEQIAAYFASVAAPAGY